MFLKNEFFLAQFNNYLWSMDFFIDTDTDSNYISYSFLKAFTSLYVIDIFQKIEYEKIRTAEEARLNQHQ